MGKVEVRQAYRASVYEAQTCWCDTARWAEWVDGLARVIAVAGDWPQLGASITWESGPAGRGRVHERVEEYEALAGMTVSVEDETMTGRQRVSFEPVPEGVVVRLSLEYSIKRRSPLTPLVDRLFVRRPMLTSLSKTLERFAPVLAESRQTNLG